MNQLDWVPGVPPVLPLQMVLVLDLLYKCFLGVPQNIVVWGGTTQDPTGGSSHN